METENEKTTEMVGQETKPRKSGFGLRLAQAIILLVLSLLYTGGAVITFLSDGLSSDSTVPLLCASAAILLWSVLLFILGSLGKKHKWANIVYLIMDGLFCLSGIGAIFFIWGVIGAVMGIQSFSDTKRKQEIPTVPSSDSKTDDLPASNECEEHSQVTTDDFAKVCSGEKNKKSAWILFGVMAVYYLFLLVFGILSMAMPRKGIAWGPYENEAYTIAMNVISGFIILLQLPSFGYFFVFREPVRLAKKASTITVASCIAATVVGDVLFYLLMRPHLPLVSISMKIAPIFAEIGLLAIYLLGFVHISPEKLRKTVYQKSNNTWKDIIGELFFTFKNLIKFLLRNRTKTSFIIAGTLAFTLGLFSLLEAVFVLFGLAVLMLFIVLIDSLYMPQTRHEYRVSDSFGNVHTLQYDSYNGFSGEDIYRDEAGNEWATKDGGTSFYPITYTGGHPEDSTDATFMR